MRLRLQCHASASLLSCGLNNAEFAMSCVSQFVDLRFEQRQVCNVTCHAPASLRYRHGVTDIVTVHRRSLSDAQRVLHNAIVAHVFQFRNRIVRPVLVAVADLLVADIKTEDGCRLLYVYWSSCSCREEKSSVW